MSESANNLFASLASKANSGQPKAIQSLSSARQSSTSGDLSFSREFNRVSDVRRQADNGESRVDRSRTAQSENRQKSTTIRDGGRRDIERQSNRNESSEEDAGVVQSKRHESRVKTSSATQASSSADRTQHSGQDTDSAAVDAAQARGDSSVQLNHQNSVVSVNGGTSPSVNEGNTQAGKHAAEQISETLDVSALLEGENSSASPVQSGEDSTLLTESGEPELAGHEAVSSRTTDEFSVSLNMNHSSVATEQPGASDQPGLSAGSTAQNGKAAAATAEMPGTTIAARLQSLERIRNTAETQRTAVTAPDSEDALLHSSLVSRYKVAGGMQTRDDADANTAASVLARGATASTTASALPGTANSLSEGAGLVSGRDSSVMDLPETSIVSLHATRLQQLADKQMDKTQSDADVARQSAGNLLESGEPTDARQKAQFSVAQSQAMAADNLLQAVSIKDQVAGNTLTTVSGGIVTAPLVSRSDAGASPVTNAPVNVPLLTPSADTSMLSNVRWMLNEGVRHAVVNVTPSGMGPISVQIGIENEQMNVSIVANQGSTRDALEALLPRLREQLASQGHDSVRVDISDGKSEQSKAGGGQQSSQFQQQSQEQLGDTARHGSDNRSNGQSGSDEQQAGFDDAGDQLVAHDMFAPHQEGVLRTRSVFDAYV